jgi:hypothetical protein
MATRWLVFNTQGQANAANTVFTNRMLQAYAKLGYTVQGNGVIGRNVSGSNKPQAQKTTNFAVPIRRLDGKWLIRHPETHPIANEVVEGVETWQQYILRDNPSTTIEEEQSSWWPTLTFPGEL